MKSNHIIKEILIRVLIYGGLVFAAFVGMFSYIMTSAFKPDTKVTPKTFNIPFEKVILKTSDNIELSSWWIPAKKSTYKVIILCHGLGADKSDMVNLMPFLRAAGYNIFAFDFRGHGENKGHRTSLGYLEVNDVTAAIEYVKKKGMKRIGLMGFSMGGATAIRTAARVDGIDALVTDSAYAELMPLIGHYAKKFYKMPYYPMVPIVKFVTEVWTGYDYDSVKPYADIAKLNIPVLIIHGDADTNIPPENADRLFKAAKMPKDLFIVPGAGHVESHATEQKEYEKMVIKFFNRYMK